MTAPALLLRISGPDFCAGAEFRFNGTAYFCTRTAPKLAALRGMNLSKAEHRGRLCGFDIERINPESHHAVFLFDWNRLTQGSGPIRGRLVRVSDPAH